MSVTRIKNNQITDLTVNAASKLQDFSVTSAKIANNLTYDSNLTIIGNLTVQGNVTAIDTQNLVVEDPLILLAKDQTGAPSLDIGFIGERGDELNAAFVWDESEGQFITALTSDSVTNTTITISSYASLRVLDLDAANVTITGNTSIGNITVNADSVIDMGNVVIGNVADPVASNDAATKAYVDSSASSGFTIEDDAANTTVVSGGDTLVLLGTADQMTVLITDTDEVTFGLTDNVTVQDTLTVTNTANVTDLNASSNVAAGNAVITNDVSANTGTFTGNVSGDTFLGNIDGTTGVFTGNISGGNISATGDISGATLETTGNVLIGGNLIVQGNITYINIEDLRVEDPIIVLGTGPNGAPLSVNDGRDRGVYMEYFLADLGNAFMGFQNSSSNMIIANDVEFSGNNIVQVNSFGNLNVGNLFPESIDVGAGNITAGNLNTGGQVVATGNVSGGNLVTAGVVDATGNVTGGNLVTGGVVDATGNVSGGNITTAGVVDAAGNVSGGNITTAGDVTTATVTASGNVSGGNIAVTGIADLGNIRIEGDDITNKEGNDITFNVSGADINIVAAGTNNANLFVIDAGTDTVLIGTGTPTVGAALKIGTTDSFLLPVGNLVQRPGTPAIGMLRFTTASDALEVYGSAGWNTVGEPSFTVIVADQFSGDGSTVVFTLTEDSTTAATIISLNGVVQEPTTAYAVSGNVLTFTEAPGSSDNIDARIVTTTTTITGIRNISGNAEIQTLDTADTVQITGNLLPAVSNVYDLGSSSLRWNELFLTGSTITLGNVVIKNTTGNSVGFFGADGTTPGAIDSNNIDTTSISNGTSSVAVAASGGNVAVSVSGNANVGLFTGNGLVVTGSIEATGNIQAGNLNVSGIGAMTTLNVSGDSLLSGNLTVSGTTITANVSTVVITDPILGLGRGANGDPLISNDGLDRGIEMFYFTDAEQTAFMGFDNNEGKMISASNVSIANSIVTVNSFGTTVVGTLEGESVTATGNVTGGNLITAGLVSLSSIIKTGSNGVGNIGQVDNSFDTIFAKATSAQYADLAEMYEADAAIKPGTVVAFGGVREVTISYVYNDARVAGVVSTNPSYIMNSAQAGEHPVAVALTGRVPTCVTGVVRKGDMMVSAGDGTACACAAPQLGTVIGKALEDHDGESGMIEVVVGRV